MELLAPAGRCAVDNDARRQEREVLAENSLNVVRAVAIDGQTAAFGGSLRTKGCEDEMAAWLQGLAQHVEVVVAIGSVDHEVEYSAIVPDLIALTEIVGADAPASGPHRVISFSSTS